MVCTRNNNFSNRGQKAIITVNALPSENEELVVNTDSDASTASQMNTISIMLTIAACFILVIGIGLILRKHGTEPITRRYNNIIRSCQRWV